MDVLTIALLTVGILAALKGLQTASQAISRHRTNRRRNAAYNRDIQDLIDAGNAISTARRGKYAR